MITQADIDAASMDPDTKVIVTDLLARIVTLEAAPGGTVSGPTAMTVELPDGSGGVTVDRFEKV